MIKTWSSCSIFWLSHSVCIFLCSTQLWLVYNSNTLKRNIFRWFIMSVSINRVVKLGKLYIQFLFLCVCVSRAKFYKFIWIGLYIMMFQISLLHNWDEYCLSYYNYGMSAVKNFVGRSVDDTNCIEITSSLWFTSTKIKY